MSQDKLETSCTIKNYQFHDIRETSFINESFYICPIQLFSGLDVP